MGTRIAIHGVNSDNNTLTAFQETLKEFDIFLQISYNVQHIRQFRQHQARFMEWVSFQEALLEKKRISANWRTFNEDL